MRPALLAGISIGLIQAAFVLPANQTRPANATIVESPQTPTVIDGLTKYAAGAYAQALAPVRTVADLEAVYKTLSTQGATWIDSAGDAAAVARRRLVAATFALDIAGGPLPDLSASADWIAERDLRMKLLAWGGAALTTAVPVFRDGTSPPGRAMRIPPAVALPQNVPAQPAERTWFRAAIAVAESLEAWEGLIDLPPVVAARAAAAQALPPTYPLVPFALARFPDDPHVLLARAVVEEHFACSSHRCPLADFRLDRGSALNVEGSVDISDDAMAGIARYSFFQGAQGHYKALTVSTVVGADANLRFGFLQIGLGRRPLARQHFAEANRLATDSVARCLSQLFTAVSWEIDGQIAEAEAAYRAALEIAPGSRSAATRLAALLFANDRAAGVMPLLETALFPTSPALDPWIVFPTGEGYFWSVLVDRMREQLK